MPEPIVHEMYRNILSTAIAIGVLVLSYIVCHFVFIRKMETPRQKRRFRVRLFYLICIIFLFLMARIWVVGFTHLLAVLGLVSAALVVTNKETIMNFVGWLIIIWRGLFSEDDLIQIQQYKGYVKTLGILYFTLSEVTPGVNAAVTGRVIRVPNGLVANNPLINFSQASHFLYQQFSVIITPDSNVERASVLLNDIVTSILNEKYKNTEEFSMAYIEKRNKQLASHIHLNTKVSVQPKFDKPSGTELLVRYYCFTCDSEEIQQAIWSKLITQLKEEKEVHFTYGT